MAKIMEQPIVDFLRQQLNFSGFPLPSVSEDENHLIVYEQDSYKQNSELLELFQHASKCNANPDILWTDNADFGKPEFIIINTHNNLAIVVECKPKIANHSSKKLREEGILVRDSKVISRYSVEGALHYAKYLSANYDVIAIAVSGTPDNYRIDTFAWEKGRLHIEDEKGPFVNLNIHSILSYKEYTQAFDSINTIKRTILEKDALSVAQDLNQTLYDASVPPIDRSLLISGLLLVLRDPVFINSYRDKIISEKKLLKLLGDSMETELEELKVQDSFKFSMVLTRFKDVFNQPGMLKDNARVLRSVLDTLKAKVYPCMQGDFSLDIIGKFYSEFLRYAKGDQSSGIVLTPPHITELFCDLVNLQIDDVVLDPCSGTGGFLVSAMNRMFKLAEKFPNSEDEKEKIKTSRLIGCDDDKLMFSLGCSNMILRGDGKANMYYGSCFDHQESLRSKKPTVGMINPPYSGSIYSPLQFVDFLCDTVEKGSLVCSIIPIACAYAEENKLMRQQIMQKHTLVAVMSMPIELFRPIGTVPCIMLFKAQEPHDKEIPTYLGNWKDDGYKWKKGVGRIPDGSKALEAKERWIKSFKRTIDDPNIGIWQCLDGTDECCWERYAKTDYSKLDQSAFELEIKKYLIFQLNQMDLSEISNNKENNNDFSK